MIEIRQSVMRVIKNQLLLSVKIVGTMYHFSQINKILPHTIYTIFVRSCIFPGHISNKYVNSS